MVLGASALAHVTMSKFVTKSVLLILLRLQVVTFRICLSTVLSLHLDLRQHDDEKLSDLLPKSAIISEPQLRRTHVFACSASTHRFVQEAFAVE